MLSEDWEPDSAADQWRNICFWGAVKKAVEGKRGQAFLKEMITALDALPKKELIEDELEIEGQYCAIGSVGRLRGIDMSDIQVDDWDKIAEVFGIAPSLVRAIEFENDQSDYGATVLNANQRRWERVRRWCVAHLKEGAF